MPEKPPSQVHFDSTQTLKAIDKWPAQTVKKTYADITETPEKPENQENEQTAKDDAQLELEKTFESFSANRKNTYPDFAKLSLLKQKAIIVKMQEELNQEYSYKLYLGKFQKHSSLKTKAFCYHWFVQEQNIAIKEEALNKFEERISVEEALTYIFEKFDEPLQREYPHFFESTFDQKEIILAEMLKAKLEKEQEEHALTKAYEKEIQSALQAKIISSGEYAELKNKAKEYKTAEQKSQALQALEKYLDLRQTVIDEFNELDLPLRFKHHQRFYKVDLEGKKNLLKKIHADIDKRLKTEEKEKAEQEDQHKTAQIYLNIAHTLEQQNKLEDAKKAYSLALKFHGDLAGIEEKIKKIDQKIKAKKMEDAQTKTTLQIMDILADVEQAAEIEHKRQELLLEKDIIAVAEKTETLLQKKPEAEKTQAEAKTTLISKPHPRADELSTAQTDQAHHKLAVDQPYEIARSEISSVEEKPQEINMEERDGLQQAEKLTDQPKVDTIKITAQGADLNNAQKQQLTKKINFAQSSQNQTTIPVFTLTDGDRTLNTSNAKSQLRQKAEALGAALYQKALTRLGEKQKSLSSQHVELIKKRQRTLAQEIDA